MENKISPKYIMNLISKIEKELWNQYGSYKNVRYYIEKWQEWYDEFESNFTIYEKDNEKIDLLKTLHYMDNETLIKIAIDLGIETPGFIPLIPIFKNVLKEEYPSAYDSFEKAFKQVMEFPDIAIGLANSTLESIIKEILAKIELEESEIINKTLYELTQIILKKFKFYPDMELPIEIRNIGSSLLNIAKNVEKLRSEKTDFHGKISVDYKVDEPLYAYFIINAIATMGLFLDNYYNDVFIKEEDVDDEDIPF